ncbi:nuclease-related domain-containing protein [Arcobacter arenosus]|uniref:nuclease-related domain-containing protein n=1 Tax=Arcobacter arenosus TaxID=2576037 RepID=UPI003BA8DA8F
MILKEIDKQKEEDIKLLKEKLKLSKNEKQKYLIKQEISRLETGLTGEKETAYFIDFNLKDSENYVILHDLRLEIDGLTAQIDHLLINKAIGIILLETKNTKAEVTINDDGTMLYEYGKNKSYNQANPLEQSKRHELVLEKILDKYNMKLNILSYVVFLPNVIIKNKTLPKNFLRSDTFYDSIYNEFAHSPKKVLTVAAKLIINKIPSTKEIRNIGNILVSEHKPVNIDYNIKYKIKNEIEEKVEEVIVENSIYNERNIKKFKDIKNSKKYMGNEMLSFVCISCGKEQRKGLKTFSEKEVFCNHCKV